MTNGLSLRKKKENTALPREATMNLIHLLGGGRPCLEPPDGPARLLHNGRSTVPGSVSLGYNRNTVKDNAQ